jgi:cell division protein FtsB
MYCNNCGSKINEGDKICPECGADTSAEFCGGFWGLVSGEGQPEQTYQQNPDLAGIEDEMTVTDNSVTPERPKKAAKRFNIRSALPLLVLALAVALLSAVCVRQNNRIDSLNQELDAAQTSLETVEKELDDSKAANDKLKSENEMLRGKMNRGTLWIIELKELAKAN